MAVRVSVQVRVCPWPSVCPCPTARRHKTLVKKSKTDYNPSYQPQRPIRRHDVRLLERSYDMMVMAFGVFLYGLALIPAGALVRWGMGLGFPWAVFTWPAAFYLFLVCLIVLAGAIKTLCLPRLKPGTYKFDKDRHVFVWFLSRSLTEYVLTPFNRIIFTNDILRYLCLRLFGVKLAYSSGISSSFLSDFDLLSFGENCMIGGWAVLYGHVEPEPGTLILAPITIGDHTLVGARCIVGCGTRIGDHTVVGFDCTFGVNAKVGNHCQVGFATHMGHHALIEDRARIGKGCHLGNGVKVREGITVPDFALIPDMTTLSTQAMADAYRTGRHPAAPVQAPAVPAATPAPRPRVVIRQSVSSSSSK